MPDYFQTQDLIASFEPSLSPEVFDRRLLIVGLGGNGPHVALAAARMGFSMIVGVDRDVVSESNLSRQVLYTREDFGRRKAEVAAEALDRHNLRSRIETHHLDILAERRRFLGLVAGADLVFLALDDVLRRRRLLPCPQAGRDRRDVRPLGVGHPCLVDGVGAVAVPELPGPGPPVDGRVGPLLPQRRRRGTRPDGGRG